MPIRVLVCHNRYQHRGGEDSVVEAEVELLRRRGHLVKCLFADNDQINKMGAFSLLTQTLWSRPAHSAISNAIDQFGPDVIHVHNSFPLLSPSIYWAADRLGVPVVQTLHNFRLICLNALFLRNSAVCEACMARVPWRGVLRGCYRGSRVSSSVLAAMLVAHRGIGTYRQKVTRYIALNEFCRSKFIGAGLPPKRVAVKPNFVDFPAPPQTARSGLLFVGRLSAEKGITTLASALKRFSRGKLRILGDGPESYLLKDIPEVSMLGSVSGEVVRQEMSRASALVVPSIWYENFPRTLVEAFGCGLPVIASRIGALAELVEDRVTGLLFEPGDPASLAEAMRWALAHPAEMAAMGKAARAHYEANFTADKNYQQLMAIYEDAIAEKVRPQA